MISSISQANKEMADKLRVIWNDYVHWPDFEFIQPDSSATWARWNIQYALGDQASLATVDGKRRWSREGFIIVQVFTPLQTGLEALYDATEIVVGAYEGNQTPGGVWFRNVRINDATDMAGLFNQKNIVANFEYDQIH